MASAALARLTGVVLSSDRRTGVSTKSGEARPYDFTNITVLVANKNVVEATLPKPAENGVLPLANGIPGEGEEVDFLCEFSVYGRDISARILTDFPAYLPNLVSA